MYDVRIERQAAMSNDRRSLRRTLMVTLGLLALGPACSPRCEAATEALEPLADHLPVPAFTAEQQTLTKTEGKGTCSIAFQFH